jgi:hypothetical protein
MLVGPVGELAAFSMNLLSARWLTGMRCRETASEPWHYCCMCRSIKTLRPPYTDHAGADEYHAAALQYVRKVSGFRAPSAKNQAAFDEAVEAIAAATAELMASLQLPAPKAARTQGEGY